MAEPFFSVVKGNATAEEIAALTVVLTALAARRGSQGSHPGDWVQRSRWNDTSGPMYQPVSHGPGAWQASARRGFG
jgi:hypothetical protein